MTGQKHLLDIKIQWKYTINSIPLETREIKRVRLLQLTAAANMLCALSLRRDLFTQTHSGTGLQKANVSQHANGDATAREESITLAVGQVIASLWPTLNAKTVQVSKSSAPYRSKSTLQWHISWCVDDYSKRPWRFVVGLTVFPFFAKNVIQKLP